MAERSGLDEAGLVALFPFYFLLSPLMEVTAAGPSLQKLLPPSLTLPAPLSTLFTVKRPPGAPSFARLSQPILVLLQLRAPPALLLRGQLVKQGESLLFAGSPWVTSAEALTESGIGMRDFAIHDAQMDTMTLLHTQRLSMAELEQLAAMHQAARQEAEALSALKMRFLAVMSHELRTPLHAVIGYTALLQQEALPVEATPAVDQIRVASETLLALVDDLLDFSKLESGRMEVEREEVPLLEAVEEVVGLVEGLASDKRLSLWIRVEEVCAVWADAKRLRQILLNLLSNAIKFTMVGGMEVVVRADPAPGAPGVCVEVRDTGIGIKPESITRLFQPFAQADARTTRQFGGTGLGLYISRQLAEAMGGSLTVTSAPGVGSCFFVCLPRVEGSARRPLEGVVASVALPMGGQRTAVERSLAALGVEVRESGGVRVGCDPLGEGVAVEMERPIYPSRLASALAQKREAARPGAAKLPRFQGTILVADDNLVNRRLMTALLRKMGVDVLLGENGAEAVELAQRPEVALVLMDCQMPVMDGLEATRLLREAGWSRPVVALTANATPEDRAACLAAGMDGFLSKPVQIDALVAMLQEALPRV